jgi:hypothetical protein
MFVLYTGLRERISEAVQDSHAILALAIAQRLNSMDCSEQRLVPFAMVRWNEGLDFTRSLR